MGSRESGGERPSPAARKCPDGRNLVVDPTTSWSSEMYGLAYVLVPSRFVSLQSELDQTLARFRRGGDDAFPRTQLAFDDPTEALARLHRTKFRYNSDHSVRWLDSDDAALSFDLRLLKLSEHMAACRLSEFEGTFAELEPDFDAFVRRFTDFNQRDPDTSRYGRWLNPVGHWDWWELGGRFNGAITCDRRPAGAEQIISSGPNRGRAILGNVVAALGGRAADEKAEIEANVELVASLKLAADRNDNHSLPTAVVLPMGCCTDEDRWFDRVEWHEVRPGTRAFLDVPAEADFPRLVRAAYDQFSELAAAGVAYHF